MITPDRYIFPETSTKDHFHTPSSGGEICWNNIQWVNRMNALIREYNKTVEPVLVDGQYQYDHIPYIATDPHPTQGYNVHHHSSEFDGGMIIASSQHDHRDNRNGGFAYATYHPGTGLPSHAYELEEIF